MKAIIYEQYGSPDVLKLQEIEKPIPKDNEVLIKIHATTATSAEGMVRRGDSIASRLILGLKKPKKNTGY
jgi:NADPH:quinone reductase-like Zn-dependent oxidoreductase